MSTQMKKAKEQLDVYLEIHDELVVLCEEWIREFCWTGRHLQNISIAVNNEAYPPHIMAEYVYERDSGYGPQDETDQEKIPLSIFWDDECISKERKKRNEKQMIALKEQEEMRKVQKMKDKARRYEQYLKLRQEFKDEED